jgi:hypothetical protein
MEIKVINRVKRKYIKTIKKLNKKIRYEDIEPKQFVNYMNQVYFILKSFHQLEEDIKNLNKSIENNKQINLKNKLKEDKEHQLINNTLDTFKPYIFAHFLLSQSSDEVNSR